MFTFIKPAWLAAFSIIVAASASTALAQAKYESAFDGYRRFGDEALRPWREANDTVGAIGGWKAYAREAQSDDAAAPPSSQAPGGAHGDHGSHGSSGPR